MDSALTYLPPILGVVGLVVAFMLYGMVMKYPEGEDAIRKIGDKIHEGAMVFMKREYSILILFLAAQVVLTFIFLETNVGIAVIVGALSSSIAGWIGMYSATKANVRTATAAQTGRRRVGPDRRVLRRLDHGPLRRGARPDRPRRALCLCRRRSAHSLEGFGMGASTVALFSRVGGGIFTKAADVGADLVGKVEAGIPEDDPRNPGVIADNVGDNVGDVAGMGSDIFESLLRRHDRDSIAIAATLHDWAAYNTASSAPRSPRPHFTGSPGLDDVPAAGPGSAWAWSPRSS